MCVLDCMYVWMNMQILGTKFMSPAFNEDLRSVWSIKCSYNRKWKQSYTHKKRGIQYKATLMCPDNCDIAIYY